MKKALGETQTLRAKNFCPTADPLLGAQECQNLISWRWSLPAPTDPVWWRSMHAVSSYHGNRNRPPQKPSARCQHRPPATNTHTQDWLQYTSPLASQQCNQCSQCTAYLHCTLSCAMYCSRSCLCVCLWVSLTTASVQCLHRLGALFH